MTIARPNTSAAPSAAHEPALEAPSVVVASGLLEQQHEVIRESDDTDTTYEERKSLFSLLVGAAETC